MSWEVIADELHVAPCACGQGHVSHRYIYEMDDWNRTSEHYFDDKIDCLVCSAKYHVTRSGHNFYLTPNGLDFKTEPRKIYIPMPLVVKVYYEYRSSLDRIITDFQKAGRASNLLMNESREVVRLARKELGTQSVKKILAILTDIRDNPDVYSEEERKYFAQWDDYKQELYNVRNHNRKVIDQSFMLNFERADYEQIG